MARPKGTKYIERPEDMLILFEKYKQYAIEQCEQWKQFQYVGKDGMRVEDKLKVPLTMEGFRIFGYNNGVTIKHYFDNTDDRYADYCTICSRIKDEIRENQIIGGMLGMYNPSITQRLNGLTEKVEQKTEGEVKHDVIVTLNL